ncbi:MAG: mechanosensitive ion channel family protein [Oscillospiraceae bacterium]|jgi:small conductance mechanosensitive channel
MQFFTMLQDINIGSFSLASILSAIVVFLICNIAIKLVTRIVNRAMNKPQIDNGVKNTVQIILKIVIWGLAIVIIAETLGIPSASLVAAISVVGLALSLSIQDIMSNLFSGIIVLLTKPLSAGDYVEFDGIDGTVRSVGLFHTTMLTIDNRLIYVPNSAVVSSKIYNYSKEPIRRVDRTFCASYDCSTELVKQALLEAIAADPRIHSTPEPFVALSAYLDSAVEYTVRVWCNNADYWNVVFQLNEQVRESFARNHVEMPYGHLNVHIRQN